MLDGAAAWMGLSFLLLVSLGLFAIYLWRQQNDVPPPAAAPAPDGHSVRIHIPNTTTAARPCPHTSRPTAGAPRRASAPIPCPICSELVHPSLFMGHRETCRLMRRPASQPPSGKQAGDDQESSVDDSTATLPAGTECVVCFGKQRSVAFVPCGHWCCCRQCALQVNTCPLCRQDVTQYLAVDSAAVNVCPACNLPIHPTYYISHCEVCRLQMRRREQEDRRREEEEKEEERVREAEREAEEKLKEDEAATIEAGLRAADVGGEEKGAAKCVLCAVRAREVAFTPCGHWAMCHECAEEVELCPVCCKKVAKKLVIYK